MLIDNDAMDRWRGQSTNNEETKTTMADNSTDADMAATTSHESITDSMDAEITEEQALEMATNLAAEAPMMDVNESNGSPVMPPRLIITKMVCQAPLAYTITIQ